MSSEGLSVLEKKILWYVLRGQCCPSSRVWQPAADRTGCIGALTKKMNLLDRVWQPAANYNGCLACFKFKKKRSKRSLLSAAGCLTRPDHSAEQEGRRAQKAIKALWGLISRPILDLGFFKKPMSHQKQEGGCKEIQEKKTNHQLTLHCYINPTLSETAAGTLSSQDKC